MNQIKSAYETIKLDEESKEKMYCKIREQIKEDKRKEYIWSYTKIASLVAVCACAVIIVANPIFQVRAGEYIKNTVKWITGNTKDDYLEEVNSTTIDNNMQLKIENAQRVRNEARIKYEISFPFNIEEKINLKDYKDPIELYKELFCSEIFNDCKIYVNNECINDVYRSDCIMDKFFWFCEVKDIQIKDNKLEQELIIYLNDENINDSLEFKFEFNKFKFDDKILEVNLKNKYTLKANNYSDEVKVTNIEKNKVSMGQNTYTFYGYSYTKTGIKIYCREELINEDDAKIIYLRVIDNYNTKYLFYPKFYDDGTYMEFEIYDGPADYNMEYDDYLKPDIKHIKIEVMEETGERYKEGIPISNKISEFEIDFENRDV